MILSFAPLARESQFDDGWSLNPSLNPSLYLAEGSSCLCCIASAHVWNPTSHAAKHVPPGQGINTAVILYNRENCG